MTAWPTRTNSRASPITASMASRSTASRSRAISTRKACWPKRPPARRWSRCRASDAQLAKLASLDFGDLLIGGDHYLDLDQALKDSPLTSSQSEGASASGPAASEAQPGASSSEAAQQHADAPPPSVDSGAAQGSSGTPAQQTPSQSQAANANDGPAEAAGPNHAEAAAVTIHVDDGAEQAQNHAVA